MLGDAGIQVSYFQALRLRSFYVEGGMDVGMSWGAVCCKRKWAGSLGTYSGRLTRPVGSERFPRVASKVNLKDKYQ